MPVTPQLISEVSSAPETLMLQSKWKKSAPDMSCFYSSQHQDTMIAYTNFCQLTLLKENYSAVHCHSKRPNKESYQEASCVGSCQILLKIAKTKSSSQMLSEVIRRGRLTICLLPKRSQSKLFCQIKRKIHYKVD